MTRKILCALTAVAALGIAALAPTSTSAFRGGGGGSHGGGGFHGGFHGGGGFRGGFHGGHASFARGPGHFGHAPAFGRFGRGHYNHFAHNHFHYHWAWWRHYHRPYWVYPVAGVGEVDAAVAQPVVAAQPAAAVANNNCNCLTKNYLPDGSLMFKDLCTQEAAVATPDELKAQAAGAPPQEK